MTAGSDQTLHPNKATIHCRASYQTKKDSHWYQNHRSPPITDEESHSAKPRLNKRPITEPEATST